MRTFLVFFIRVITFLYLLLTPIDPSVKGNNSSPITTYYNFEAELDRSFNRGYTDYFVNKRTEKIGSWESPKSQGQLIGAVLETNERGYQIENYEKLNEFKINPSFLLP